jgi:hypothetical protein
MKTPEEIEARIMELQKQYDALDKRGSKDLPIFDITAHYGKMNELNAVIHALKWVLNKQ